MTDKAIHVQKDVRRPMRKRVPLERGEGFSTAPDGYEECDVEVIVDLAALARHLGPRAMLNSKGISRYIEGNVIITVRNRRRVHA